MGSIPAGFKPADDGTLIVGDVSANGQFIETPLFLYDGKRIAAQAEKFRAVFPGIALHYAVKANPYGPLLAHLNTFVDGFDLASAGELTRLEASAGLSKPVSFAGPGKRDDELRSAIAKGVTINLESEHEAQRALTIAEQLGVTPKLAVRVNPPFALKGAGMKMGGLASPFGIDAARVPALVRALLRAGADWRGFHVYAGSQVLHADALIEAQAETLALAGSLASDIGAVPLEVNLGGGFGIPYAPGDRPLDIVAVGRALSAALEARPGILTDTTFAIELGRWLVGEAGVYLTRVIDRKESGGRTFVITDGGLQHMLAATGNFGQLLRRNYPIANASRFAETASEEVTVTGCLCTPLDLLGDEVMLPRTEIGDLIAVFCAGAYGLTASPQAFLSQPAANERLV
jgi:diaminopimelate decarboxylase